MQLKINKMEVQDKIREQISEKQLEENFYNAIDEINKIIIDNDYVLKIDGVEKLKITNINTDFHHLSKNAKKNLAKRLHFFNKKKTLRTINIMFWVFRKIRVIQEYLKVSISRKEKEINKLRIINKIMRAKTEEARLVYKKEKGNFYK